MYRYDSIDQRMIDERVAQYRGQIERNLAGTCSYTVRGEPVEPREMAHRPAIMRRARAT